MSIKQVFDWGCRSLAGHIFLFEVGLSFPLFLVFLIDRIRSNNPNSEWVMLVASVAALSGAVAGAIFWFALTRNLIKSRESQQKR